MILKRNIFIGSVFAIGICALAFLFSFAHITHANPSGFTRKQSATATTTVTYMTPGTATTTAIIDCQIGGSSSFGCDSGALLVNFLASTTASNLLINEEYSQGIAGIDCVANPGLCDWYESDQTVINNVSTTTQISGGVGYDIGGVPQFSWKFASSTIGGIPLLATGNLASRLIAFQSPTRYIRFVFSLKLGGANGAIYWDVVSKKENN